MRNVVLFFFFFFFSCFGLYKWHVSGRWKEEGKLLLAAIDETSPSVFVPVNFIQSYWSLRKRQNVQTARHMRACTHAPTQTHIARPCPSAAGDYVDYRMIRTPPSSSLHSLTLDLNTRRKALRSEERPPVSSPSPRKGVVFPLRPELQISDPSARQNKEESHEKDRPAPSRFRSVHQAKLRHEGFEDTLGLNSALPWKTFISLIQSHNVGCIKLQNDS